MFVRRKGIDAHRPGNILDLWRSVLAVLARAKGGRFEAMVRERIVNNPMLTTIIEPMLALLLTTREQL